MEKMIQVNDLGELNFYQEKAYLESVLNHEENLHDMVLAWANATERLVSTNIKWLVEDFDIDTLVKIIESGGNNEFSSDNDYFTIGNDDVYIMGYYDHEIKEEILSDLEYYSTEILKEYVEICDIDIATLEFVAVGDL